MHAVAGCFGDASHEIIARIRRLVFVLFFFDEDQVMYSMSRVRCILVFLTLSDDTMINCCTKVILFCGR